MNNIFKEVLYDFSIAKHPSELLHGWTKLNNMEKDKSIIISLDDYEKSAYPPDLLKLINLKDSHFIPYFKNDNLYFLNGELLMEMFNKGNEPFEFPIDYSIMLDTNYASYIDDFVNEKWNTLNNEVFAAIDVLLKNNFHYDYLFYMIENYKNSFVTGDTQGITKRKIKFYENLVSLELFKSIDILKYQNTKQINYLITKNEALISADQIFNGIFNSSDAKNMMKIFLSIHKSMVLLLIGILQIRFSDKSNSNSKMQKLFEYSNDVIGIYFERELMVAHKFFCRPSDVQILNKINKGMNTEKLFGLIENIAWDFSVPRLMEFFLLKGGEGRFFIPFFLTNDLRLRDLLRLFSVKGVVFDTEGGIFIPISDENAETYYASQGINIASYFTDEAILERGNIYKNNRDNNFEVINEQFNKLLKILS